MTDTKTPEWFELYAVYFRPLTDSQVKTWDYELREGPAKIRNFTLDILMGAIRRLATKKDWDGKTRHPGIDDVRSTIFEIMRENRKATDNGVKSSDCDYCYGTGFFCGTRFLHNREKETVTGVCTDHGQCLSCPHKDGVTVCYDLAVPCKCQQGEAEIRQGKYKNIPAIRKLQQMAEEDVRKAQGKAISGGYRC